MGGSTAVCMVKILLLAGLVLVMATCGFGHQIHVETPESKMAEGHTLREEPAATGAVYTLWGRTECPPIAARVYTGVMGGGHSGSEGGGNEYLCLSDKPESGKAGTSFNADIHGVEFKAGEELFKLTNAEKLIHHDAVCVVCRSPRSVQVMIPGQKSCMKGWTQEYYGYLMTSYNDKYSLAAKNYICMDIAPEVRMGGSEDKGGATLYPVQVKCGALPCPPYTRDEMMVCVVCSQ